MNIFCNLENIVYPVHLPNAEFPWPQNCLFAKWYVHIFHGVVYSFAKTGAGNVNIECQVISKIIILFIFFFMLQNEFILQWMFFWDFYESHTNTAYLSLHLQVHLCSHGRISVQSARNDFFHSPHFCLCKLLAWRTELSLVLGSA